MLQILHFNYRFFGEPRGRSQKQNSQFHQVGELFCPTLWLIKISNLSFDFKRYGSSLMVHYMGCGQKYATRMFELCNMLNVDIQCDDIQHNSWSMNRSSTKCIPQCLPFPTLGNFKFSKFSVFLSFFFNFMLVSSNWQLKGNSSIILYDLYQRTCLGFLV